MAFLRFSRDKRGVEHFCLVQPTTNRRGKVRPRVLYWYRTPPDVKVGREPFDPAVRRALEAQNPDVTFDWRAIIETPIPSADADKWRERRRAERAAKHAALEDESAEVAHGTAEASADPAAAVSDGGAAIAQESAADAPAGGAPAASTGGAPAASTGAPLVQAAPGAGDLRGNRRRRRRGGRGGAPKTTPPSGE